MKYHVANCVCELGKQQLHQVDVTEDAISQKGGIPRQPMHSNAGQLYWNYETLYDVMGPAVINLISLHYQYLYCRVVRLWKDYYRCVFDNLTFIRPETWSQTSVRNRNRTSVLLVRVGVSVYTVRAAAIKFWSIKLFSWPASQTKQGAMLLL